MHICEKELKRMSYIGKGELPKKVILASGSPRRRELLTEMGVEFEIDVPDVDETVSGTPEEMVTLLAERKARAVADKRESGIIVAADTLVALDGRALGKPRDDEEAKKMLRSLSGRAHEVYTGVCVIRVAPEGMEIRCKAACTHVSFRDLSDAEIGAYVATGEPRDKAGAYAIQGGAAEFVSGYEGSRSNVIGLPVGLLRSMLENLNETAH